MMKNHSPTSASHLLRQCTASALIGLCGLASAAHSEAFTFASVDIFDNGPLAGNTEASSRTAPVFAERGNAPAAYGKSRASFGSNGYAVLSGAGAVSIWSDGFTLHSGTGTSLQPLSISVSIHGAYVGAETDMSYTLLVSDHAFDLQNILAHIGDNDEVINVPGSAVLLSTVISNSDKPANITLNGGVSLADGQTFYVASIFQGDVCTPLEGPDSADCQGGSQDFFHSANFGISAPTGSTIATLSNTVYATAVPEASSLMLTLAGLATTAGLARRAKLRRTR